MITTINKQSLKHLAVVLKKLQLYNESNKSNPLDPRKFAWFTKYVFCADNLGLVIPTAR